MSVSRVKTWSAGEVLTAVDLNAEFDNLNQTNVAWPLTNSVSAAGYTISNAVLGTLKQLNENVVCIDNYASLPAAIASIGSTVTTLLINKNSNVTTDCTVPSTMTLWFVGQGKLTVSAATTCTLNGPIMAEPRQIFAGSGLVAGLELATDVYPDWWGSNTTPGSTDMATAIDAALDVLETAGGGTLKFLPTTYAYATSPNFARAGVNIEAQKTTLFSHTGTGNAFIIDGGASPASGYFGLRFTNITVQGNSNSTNGFYVRAIHHSIFDHFQCLGCAVTGAGMQVEWCVCNEWRTPRVTSTGSTLSPIPLYGMYLTRRAVSEASTTQTIINPVMEGITSGTGTGIVFDYANNNIIQGGTSESNDRGLYITINSAGNEIQNFDMESNSVEDALCEGADHIFLGLLSTSTFRFSGAGGSRCHLIGGRYNAITIESGCLNNSLGPLTYSIDGGSLTNSGTNTAKWRVFNITTTAFDTDLSPHNIVATASLPAAAAGLNGTILIEDGGAGDRNLIVYAGGQRFRIDGGAAI